MENIISIFMVLFLIVAFSLITVFFAVQVCVLFMYIHCLSCTLVFSYCKLLSVNCVVNDIFIVNVLWWTIENII